MPADSDSAPPDPEEKKIVVDDDWKDQVRKEREQLREQERARPKSDEPSGSGTDEEAEPSAEADADEPADAEAPDKAPDKAEGPEKAEADEQAEEKAEEKAESEGPQMPPASFEMLLSTLATQAMHAMGLVPGPDGKSEADRDLARHFIDTLGILEEKTRGNLTDEESQMLEQILHEMRMMFVQLK